MGNLILTDSFLSLTNSMITARSEASGYPKISTQIHTVLDYRFMADDNNANDYLLKIDYGSAATIEAIALFDCNFDTVKIQGNASDAWGAPSYDGDDLTISPNPWTGRYNIFIPLTSFGYQYSRIFIPTGTTEVGTSLSKWRVSSVVYLTTATALTKNMSYGYEETAQKFASIIQYPGGRSDALDLSNLIKWSGSVVFGKRNIADKSELQALNRLSFGSPVVVYLNDDDTSEVYLARRVGNLSGTRAGLNTFQGSSLYFEEWL